MRIKCLMLATVSSLAFTGAAAAADLPVKVGPAAFAPNYNWTGLYVGGSLAAGSYNPKSDISDPVLWEGYSSQIVEGNKLTWGVGGQIGYNWQVRRFVFGVEGDYTYLSGDASTQIGWVDSGGNADVTAKAKGLATLRARFGLDMMDGLLVYGTAGVGWLKSDYNLNVNELSGGGVPKGGNFASSKWTPAFVAGGGLEYMLSRNWSVRGEVLWVSAQTVKAAPTDTSYFNDPMEARYNSTLTLGRLGVNYRF